MYKENALFVFAGSMILISIALTLYVHPNWFWFTAFIGVNMIQSAFTGFCIPTIIMGKLGMKSKYDELKNEQ
jgi:hypothetical protein